MYTKSSQLHFDSCLLFSLWLCGGLFGFSFDCFVTVLFSSFLKCFAASFPCFSVSFNNNWALSTISTASFLFFSASCSFWDAEVAHAFADFSMLLLSFSVWIILFSASISSVIFLWFLFTFSFPLLLHLSLIVWLAGISCKRQICINCHSGTI